MKPVLSWFAMLLAFATPALASVTVSSPVSNSTVSSPVQYTASASASTCSKGVAAVGIYVNNQLAYQQNGSSLNTTLALTAGSYNTVVQEWDNCGGASATPINIIVGGGQTGTTTAVTVSSPANNSNVTSPVSFSAKATTATCAKGIAAMGIYVDNQLDYTVNGATVQISLSLPGGLHHVVVQAWDNCNGAFNTPVTITVQAANATTVGMTANPTSISAGGSSTLTVAASNATQVTIAGSDGSTYTLPNSGGTQAVTPKATTTYTATATGSSGKVTSTATVTVASSTAPTVGITANPASITAGASSALTVTAANATQLTVTGTDRSSYTLSSSGGTQKVTPKATTTYTATASGSAGKVTSTATVTVTSGTAPAIGISANPTSVAAGSSSTLTVTASNSTQVTVTGSDGSSYIFAATGGTQTVTPAATTTYTAKATSSGGSASNSVTVTVVSGNGTQAINHVIFMLQENHSFDSYFGMLNPYRVANHFDVAADGLTYAVDGIDDKLNKISNQSDEGTNYPLFKFLSTCVDDMTSSWLESYGDINRYDFSPSRTLPLDGFVHTAENFAKNCSAPGSGCSGNFTDLNGERAMGYYDQQFLNYYYYMASQFAVSDRWFSPISSKSIPNRIATFTGGTTQGLAFDPGSNDHLSQLNIPTIFSELDQAKVPWKIYYTVTQGGCVAGNPCSGGGFGQFPVTVLTYFSFADQYLYENSNGAACKAPTQPSSVVGDTSNSFCVDPTRFAPLSTYYTDLKNRTLPSFAFIESGASLDDEHPGSGQSVLTGQQEVADVVNALMTSPSWSDSAFFLSYDEGGGPYDHVPPVAKHSNDNTDPTVGSAPVSSIPDISGIAVNPDSYGPCVAPGGVPTIHCDLPSVNDPGGHSTDVAAVQGFRAQLGFRLPNIIISPFTRQHYVGHTPMDHTAVLKFVENRFIGPSAHLTARDAAQPNLLDFFDFNSVPWSTPPTPPAPVTPASLGYDPCTPQTFGP